MEQKYSKKESLQRQQLKSEANIDKKWILLEGKKVSFP